MNAHDISPPNGTTFTPPDPEALAALVDQAEAPLPVMRFNSGIDRDFSHIEDYQDSTFTVPYLSEYERHNSRPSSVYRGVNGIPPERQSSPVASVYAQSLASSESSGGRGRRRGTLAAIVEAAVARWGRDSSDGGSSNSSSSSSSSSSSVSHSRIRSRRRRGSTTTTTTARAKTPAQRAQARKEIQITKRVPREFTLFLPQSLCPTDGLSVWSDTRPAPMPLGQPAATESQRTLRTRHIKLIVAQLEAALKKNARDLRAADRLKSRQVALSKSSELLTASIGPNPDTANIPKVVLEVPTPPNRTPKTGVADLRDSTPKQPALIDDQSPLALGLSGVDGAKAPFRPLGNTSLISGPAPGNRAWWLDVASPTWEDMRVLGKLLHLHPLTLEDILHEDPREKLELFPRLGYYFVVFRGLETQAALRRPRPPDAEQEGTIGAVNVYFVVFREGIVTFHFEDIAEHADRVRQKIIEFEQTIQMSSDWISHGLMDSMVDAFVPLLRTIEQEVEGVDALITNPQNSLESVPLSEITLQGGSSDAIEEKVHELNEKSGSPSSYPGSRLQSRIKSWKSRIWSLMPKRLRLGRKKAVIIEPPTKLATFQTLLRMATTRRLVTSLVRLLATKSEVIGQLRKRLQGGSGGAVDWDEGDMARGQEVGIYLGDVQDHILTMQQSLNHYERILSHDHPAYIAHLRLLLSEAKGDKDKMILTLSLIIFTVPAMQFPMGLGGMNVEVPTQRDTPYYTYFAIWLAVSVGVMLAVLALVWWWWRRAKKKRRTNVKI